MIEIKKAYIDTESGQIHYRYLSGNGTPLLFFHRTPASSIMFEKMMLEMKDERPMSVSYTHLTLPTNREV